jgi:SAM-dependent methyltransferase
MLRTSDTQCSSCRRATPEKVLASTWIRELPENEVFGGKLRIVECQSCGLRYLNPMPDLRDLGHIYNYDVYEDSTNNNPVLMEHFLDRLRANTQKLSTVMEIGCGTGDFLAYLESQGLEASGVEFADSVNRVKFKGKLYVGRMEELDIPDAAFDAVLLLNVIEHLSDPPDVLGKIRRMLPPGGALLLRHPNSDLFFNPAYHYLVELPKFLYHRFLRSRGKKTGFTVVGFQNQHLFYFNRRSVSRMLEQSGFRVAEFGTVDPYNRLRMKRSFGRGNIVEGAVAGVRHLLGFAGLGPECLIVAIANDDRPATGAKA